MQETERVAAILKPSEIMLAWINAHAEEDETLDLEDIQTDCTVILLPAFDDEEAVEVYLDEIYSELFTHELMLWNEDESTWPDNRSLETFLAWFDIEIHSLVYDCAEAGHVMRQDTDTLQ